MEVEFTESKEKSMVKLIDNSDFFARFEFKENKVWVVWGNPNCKRHNETLIKKSRLTIIQNAIDAFLQKIP